jgi:sugar/nucleoside kinase (ribokinase family)
VASKHKQACLVLGDLCLDVHARLDIPPDSIGPLAAGSDVTALGDVYGLPGGTTWLFADALTAAYDTAALGDTSRGVVPVIMAVVGADWAGDFLGNAATDRGWPTDGIVRVVGMRTDIVATTGFAGRARLMVIPTEKVSHKFLPWDIQRAEWICRAFDVCFAWVSGYLFESYGNSVIEAARAMFARLRANSVPIVLDLVPHDFLAKVGHLERLEADVGPLDVIVGEFTTLAALGFGQRPQVGEDPRPNMLACARSAAAGRLGAVVQHRVSVETYAQAIAGQSVAGLAMSKPVPATGPRGLGDALAVQALSALGLIPLALSRAVQFGDLDSRGVRVRVAQLGQDGECLGP